MKKGYLICKSAFDAIKEDKMTQKAMDEANNIKDSANDDVVKMFGNGKDIVTAIKCPLTGDMIDKSKVRKVYFF